MKKQWLTSLCSVFMLCACTNATEAKPSMIKKSDLQGTWLIEVIKQKPVIDRSPATIIFDKSGSVAGNSSCNRLKSSYQLVKTDNNQHTKLTFGQVASTMMMCSETLINQERQFLKALTRVTQVTIKKGLLILLDDNQQVMFKASIKRAAVLK